MSEDSALVIGSQVYPIGLLSSDGGCVVFTPMQMRFIKEMQKLKSTVAACMAVGWAPERGEAFLRSRKFQKYVASKMDAFSVQAGMTEEAWWVFLRDVKNGYRETWRGVCEPCGWAEDLTGYEVASARGDDGVVRILCGRCGKDARVDYERILFRPKREQIMAWQEWGARVSPKTERVMHATEKAELAFESEEARP